MEVKTKKSKLKTTLLENKRVLIKPVRRKGSWLANISPNHIGDFQYDNTFTTMEVPLNETTNKLVDPLLGYNKECKEEFCDLLALKMEDINIHKSKNFWTTQRARLNKLVLPLDLNNIDNLVTFLVIQSNKDKIAPTWAERKARGTYRWAIQYPEEMAQETKKRIDYTRECWKFYGKIEGNRQAMYDFLYIYYMDKKSKFSYSDDSKLDFLEREFEKLVEQDAEGITLILDDDMYETKVIIYKATKYGIMTKKGHKYFPAGADTAIGVLSDVIKYLDDKQNSEDRISIIQKISAKEDK